MKHQKTRREFMKRSSSGIIGIGMASSLLPSVPEAQSAQDKVKVAVVRNEQAISNRNICDEKQAKLMIEKALLTVTGKQNPKEAWAFLGLTKDDTVGIKVNCNGANFPLYAHPELVYALCESLSNVLPLNNIIIYERNTSELTRAGFKANKNNTGVRCFGTNEGGGFHPQEGLTPRTGFP